MDRALNLVIFGASGDLTARKLLPALYRLARKGRLPAEARVVGVARSALGEEGFRKKAADAVRKHAEPDWDDGAWKDFAGRLFYVAADAAASGGLDPLAHWLAE